MGDRQTQRCRVSEGGRERERGGDNGRERGVERARVGERQI